MGIKFFGQFEKWMSADKFMPEMNTKNFVPETEIGIQRFLLYHHGPIVCLDLSAHNQPVTIETIR